MDLGLTLTTLKGDLAIPCAAPDLTEGYEQSVSLKVEGTVNGGGEIFNSPFVRGRVGQTKRSADLRYFPIERDLRYLPAANINSANALYSQKKKRCGSLPICYLNTCW